MAMHKTNFLEGRIFLPMLKFSIPIMLSIFFQQMYNTVDTMIVGYTLGEETLAAIGVSSPIFELFVGFALGFGNGLSIIIARSYGTRDERLLKNSVAGSIFVGLIVSIVITVLSIIFMSPLLKLLKTPQETFALSYAYIRKITLFTIVLFMYNLCAGMLRAVGNSFMPLVFLIISSVLNIGLDFLFITVFKRGISGAAEATVISQAVSVALCVIYIYKAVPSLIPSKENFIEGKAMHKKLTVQGLSMGFMSCIVSAGTVILQSAINGFGYLIIAGHTAARRLFQVTLMPYSAMGQSVNTFVSQNYGADNAKRIRKGMLEAYIYDGVITIIMTALIWLFAPALIKFISGSDETELVSYGSRYIKFMVPFYSVLGLLTITRTSLQAIDSRILPVLSSVMELIGKILFTILLIPRFGIKAVIVCEPLIWCFMVVELIISFWTNKYIRTGKME